MGHVRKTSKLQRFQTCAARVIQGVQKKTPKTIENDLLLEFQCLALN